MGLSKLWSNPWHQLLGITWQYCRNSVEIYERCSRTLVKLACCRKAGRWCAGGHCRGHKLVWSFPIHGSSLAQKKWNTKSACKGSYLHNACTTLCVSVWVVYWAFSVGNVAVVVVMVGWGGGEQVVNWCFRVFLLRVWGLNAHEVLIWNIWFEEKTA